MADQAELLRLRIRQQQGKNLAETVAVISGKGGVGKSNFSLNFSILLSKLGKQVLLFDMDIGMGNIDILIGKTVQASLTDYLEGKTILNHLSTKLEKDIYKETNITCKVSFDNKFNNYSEKVQKLLLEENIKTLKVYTIEKEITTSWEINNITKTISDTMTTLEKKQFTPKNYTFIITNEKDSSIFVFGFNYCFCFCRLWSKCKNFY